MKYYLTIDISETTGRHVAGHVESGRLLTEEVYRFSHSMKEEEGHKVWDLTLLYEETVAGIRAARERLGSPACITLCGWGVDYVLLSGEEAVLPCYAAADKRTERFSNLANALVSPEELYRSCGYRLGEGGTAYQLMTDQITGRLEGATDFLMIPEYLLYRLGGVKVKEATLAATTGLVSREAGGFDPVVIGKMNLPQELFPALTPLGAEAGRFEDIPLRVGVMSRSAAVVEGIPMTDRDLFLFSGVRSLLGARTAAPLFEEDGPAGFAFFNEGGAGYNRCQTILPGTAMADRLREELCPSLSREDIETALADNDFSGTVDAYSPAFIAPNRMKYAFDAALGSQKPRCAADYLKAAYRSLLEAYERSVRGMGDCTGASYETLYVVGDSGKNTLFYAMLAERTGLRVVSVQGDILSQGNFRTQMEETWKPQLDYIGPLQHSAAAESGAASPEEEKRTEHREGRRERDGQREMVRDGRREERESSGEGRRDRRPRREERSEGSGESRPEKQGERRSPREPHRETRDNPGKRENREKRRSRANRENRENRENRGERRRETAGAEKRRETGNSENRREAADGAEKPAGSGERTRGRSHRGGHHRPKA